MKYSDTASSLWFYFKDEANDFKVNITEVDDFKCLKYKAKLIGYGAGQPTPNGANWIVGYAVPLKQLSNFWQSLEIPLIYCKKWNLNERSILRDLCLVLKILMLILIILFSLSKNKNYISLSSLYQQKMIKTS